jgi:hypothetical protein
MAGTTAPTASAENCIASPAIVIAREPVGDLIGSKNSPDRERVVTLLRSRLSHHLKNQPRGLVVERRYLGSLAVFGEKLSP